jgi:hypothetical protein
MQWAANGRWLDGAVVALLLVAGFLIPLGALSKPSDQDPSGARAVLFAPWIDAGGAMRRAGEAGARIVRFGALPFIVIVEPERADFAARASKRGALLIVDPRALAACFTARPA